MPDKSHDPALPIPHSARELPKPEQAAIAKVATTGSNTLPQHLLAESNNEARRHAQQLACEDSVAHREQQHVAKTAVKSTAINNKHWKVAVFIAAAPELTSHHLETVGIGSHI
jgi:hypothetical protein